LVIWRAVYTLRELGPQWEVLPALRADGQRAIELGEERGGACGVGSRHGVDVRAVRVARGLQFVERTGGPAAAYELGPGG
jgi:hypothetical protein